MLTIDKCQSADSDIVLLSCGKQINETAAKDLKRIGVALSKARKMLVIIGTEEYLKDVAPLEKVLGKMRAEGWVQEISNFDTHMLSYLSEEGRRVMAVHE